MNQQGLKVIEIEKLTNISSKRGIEETFENYKLRQKIVKEITKRYLRGNLVFMSKMLLPKLNEKGEVETGRDGKPVWVGHTPGLTYVKEFHGELKAYNEK